MTSWPHAPAPVHPTGDGGMSAVIMLWWQSTAHRGLQGVSSQRSVLWSHPPHTKQAALATKCARPARTCARTPAPTTLACGRTVRSEWRVAWGAYGVWCVCGVCGERCVVLCSVAAPWSPPCHLPALPVAPSLELPRLDLHRKRVIVRVEGHRVRPPAGRLAHEHGRRPRVHRVVPRVRRPCKAKPLRLEHVRTGVRPTHMHTHTHTHTHTQ